MMARKTTHFAFHWPIVVGGLLALVFSACTDADVFETPGLGAGAHDDKLKIEGSFCTEHPDELLFPVKIMFIIDCSQSMLVTDPQPSPNEFPGRVRAIWDVIQQFRTDPGVSFAIIRFEAAANVATQADTNGDGVADTFGFVNDLAALLRALNSLVNAGGNTSYQAALGLAEATLAMDMSTTSVDERARTKYVIIFLSDGLPYPQNYDDDSNTPASILRALRELMNLPKRFDVSDFTFHTAYLSAGTPPQVAQQAEALLKSMADIGGGTYRNFENGEEINFLDIDYTSIKRAYNLKDGAFVAFNMNAHPGWSHELSVDTDGDGLIDKLEIEIGTSIGERDTDGDGFNDMLEYNLRDSGFDPLDPDDADCALALDRLDRDGDGLLDCEERFIGTNPELFDTDADGIPDPIEIRGGTNPVWNDTATDLDFDGSRNGSELAWHTNPVENDAARFSKLAYRYDLERVPGVFESRTCYDFAVDNITLVGTQPRTVGDPEGYNDIYVYAGQVPQDDPDDFGTFRVACARARYVPRYPEPDLKYPPSGVIRFEQKDFKRPQARPCDEDSDCPHHVCDPELGACLAPLGQECDEQTPCPNFECIDIDPATGEGICASPLPVACLAEQDCPEYPLNPQTGTCMDPAHSLPDPQTGACPRRECVPAYTSCSSGQPCPPDGDSNPDNDPECIENFCRVPCRDAAGCNPGESCDPDPEEFYPACSTPADCTGTNPDCVNGRCRELCIVDGDCPSGQTCSEGICQSKHCVSHQGGSCAPVVCRTAADCPRQPCDEEVGRCLPQPCIDSRQCPHQHCEIIIGACMGPSCQEDSDCRGERGFTCNEIIGDSCDKDIDCPYNFCNVQRRRCQLADDIVCQGNADCPRNTCSVPLLTNCTVDADCPGGGACVNNVCVGVCALPQGVPQSERQPCSADLDCAPDYCELYYVCENDQQKECVTSLDCPQTFCSSSGTCINDPSISCNPGTENIDNNCQVGTCNRAGGIGSCDTAQHEACSSRDDCPNYRCKLAVGECYYPVEVACTTAADCPEPGMQCGARGFCVMPCTSDADCPRARCQGRCIPLDPNDRMRCTDWFDPERDCKVFGAPSP